MNRSRIARVVAGLLGVAGLLASGIVAGPEHVALGQSSQAPAISPAPTSTSPLAPPPNGPRRVETGTLILSNVTLHPRPGERIENATIVIRDGIIAEIRPGGHGGSDAHGGVHVYAGFIEPLVEVDVPRPDPDASGVHHNPRVTPQRSALDAGADGIDAGAAASLRSLGFTAAGIAPGGAGMFKGLGSVVSLAERPANLSAQMPPVYARDVLHSVSLDHEGWGGGGGGDDGRWSRYPSSQMGAIAVIRQTLSDADWYAAERSAGRAREPVGALEALTRRDGGQDARPTDIPLLVSVDDELEALRAAKLAAEFDRALIVLGSGQEYQRLGALAQTKVPVIVPLNFPPAPTVSTIGQASSVALRELMHWEQAPTNPRRVVGAGIAAALTSGKIDAKLGGRGAFAANLSKAIKHGLGKDQALAMLTTGPAAMLGVSDRLGTVEVGKVANLVLADAEMFTDVPDPVSSVPGREPGFAPSPRPGRIVEVVIDGRRHSVAPRRRTDLAGVWTLAFDPALPAALIGAGGVEGVLILEIDDAGDGKWPPEVTVVRTLAPPEGAKPETKPEIRRAKAAGVTFAAEPAGQGVGAAVGLPTRVHLTVDQEALMGPGAAAGAGGVGGVGAVAGVWSVTASIRSGDAGGQATIVGDARGPDGAVYRVTATRTGPLPPKDAPGPLDGTWTRIDNVAGVGRAAAPTPEHVHLVIRTGPDADGRKLSVQAKRGTTDLKTELLSARLDGSEPTAEIVVSGINPAVPDATTRVRLTLRTLGDGGAAGGRLVGTFGDGEQPGAEAFTLARYRATPEADAIAAIPEQFGLPFGPFARASMPEATPVVIRGATLWTSGPAGVIENGTLVLSGGKIAYAGDAAGGAEFLARVRFDAPPREIDGRGEGREGGSGLHVTPGIIDCHSHTGISGGVNEGAQAISAEVRIADVTDPDTVSWYRQLASGVTAVNSLHGSANAIGGQSQVNKIRWGCGSPDDMHMQGAAPGIKFALGENPKQSNWGDRAVTRYPQTRMGVETIIRDRFVAAREYAASRAAPGSRRDLELEAIAEILDGTRLVHCHAYRQDEILMLCRVAGEFGFRIGTFQHVLEGYKVADEIKAAAIGPSMFSDWWAFKMEVQDAVPYNGPIMHERGNVVSYNSDSDEMARRMHVEAGKAVRYSGPASPGASGGPPRIEPAEALKFITINPAIQLKIDARTGSLEAGKDADVAVFSGPPTSPLSRCVRTFVDGRELFSLEADAALRAADARERARLIQKALGVKDPAAAVASASAPASPAEPRPRPRRSLMERMAAQADDARREHYLSLYLRGLDPAFYRSGECGCESWMTGN